MANVRPDFFVSYTAADQAWAEWIAYTLEANCYSSVIQAWDIRPGANFVIEMHRAASCAERTIAVLSSTYLRKSFPAPEWSAAFSNDPEGLGRKLVPVRVEECQPAGLLRAIVYIDLVGLDEASAAKTLLRGLVPGRAKPMASPAFPGTARIASVQAPLFPGSQTLHEPADFSGAVPAPSLTRAEIAQPPAPEPSRPAEENFRLGWQHEQLGNDAEATRLYRLAADQGHAGAQVNLGFFHERGRGGLARDEGTAACLYRLAADQGHNGARNKLTLFYREGRGGLAKEDHEAVRLCRPAAGRGDASAQFKLGQFSQRGQGGLARDEGEAVRLYRLAADQGHAGAQLALGKFYSEGRGGLARDEGEAVRLYRLAAHQGHPGAQYILGQSYAQGHGGLPVNEGEAARLYRLAVDHGHDSARFYLGLYYAEGRGGLPKDLKEADFLRRSSEQRKLFTR